jgi:hypothetical protein
VNEKMTDENADFENEEFYEMTGEEAAEADVEKNTQGQGEKDVFVELEECRA